MESIKKHIEGYGFLVEEIDDGRVRGYYCKNDSSESEFILDFSEDNFKNTNDISKCYAKSYNDVLKVVYLIQIDNNADEILRVIEQNEFQDYTYLIYDKTDEIEFFLKDLWDILFTLQLMK